MHRRDILNWLKETDSARLESLWERADAVRQQEVGADVHLRGLIEISNHCRRLCHYCGLRAANQRVTRYRMTEEEILSAVHQAKQFGYGTVVLQAGEDIAITADFITHVIERIKVETDLAVTLSLGERADGELQQWRSAGADRYLLRFETSHPRLYQHIHPSLTGIPSDRVALLRRLREMGYEVGSGVMIGIPGQTYDDLANDLELFRELDLDMIGVGPFIAHPDTPLGQTPRPDSPEQVPNTELMTYKLVALTRIVCPRANIPSTSALATLNISQGRELGLQRGANIVMPNLTPTRYRALYEIYPAKACIAETADQCHQCMKNRILSLDRTLGQGQGNSPNWTSRQSGPTI